MKTFITVLLLYPVIAFSVPVIGFAGNFSGEFGLGAAVSKHDLDSCSVPCSGNVYLKDDDSTATMDLGFFYNNKIIDVGANVSFGEGLGYALALRKRLNKINLSIGAGKIDTKANIDFDTFNPFRQSADAFGNMGHVDLAYKFNKDLAIFVKYLYTTADHAEIAQEFLGFDADGNKIFGSNVEKISFESESQSIGLGIRWLF